MTRQYFYRDRNCNVDDSADPNCTCWHDEGTGPLAETAEARGVDWRVKPLPVVPPATTCMTAQQGGDHYQQGIQPVEFIHSNKLNFNEGNAIKYVTRNRRKGTPVEDLKKAIHYIQLQLKMENGIDSRIEYDAVPRS